MSTNNVYNGNNQRIGYTKNMGSTVYAHNSNGRNIGYYSKSANATFDNNGKRFGIGNLTDALVFSNSKKTR
jgi:hypothetical protein